MAIVAWTTTLWRSSKGRWQAPPSTTAMSWLSTTKVVEQVVNNLRWFIRTVISRIECHPKITQWLCKPWPDGINRESSLESKSSSSKPCQANSATTAARTFKQGLRQTTETMSITLDKASKPSSWAHFSTWRSKRARPTMDGPRARLKTDLELSTMPCMTVDW